jgi:ABC-type lipoprotein release transport system permease subunit
MFEAVLRKKRQIGIMRILGVPRNIIIRIYLLEAAFFSFFGFALANILQIVFSSIADTAEFHRLIGLELSEPLFNASLMLRIQIGTLLLLLTLLSSLTPAVYASRIEPGIILSQRES